MTHTKALISAVIIGAIAVFVVAVTLNVLRGTSDAYQNIAAPSTPSAASTETIAQPEDTAEIAEEVERASTESAPVELAEQADAVQQSTAPSATASSAAPVAPTGVVHTVTAEGLIYNPLVIQIQPGDTVAWDNMATHDTQSLEGLIPEGAEHWHSPMSENYRRTFSQEGIYIYKCTPHFGAAMGGAIIVGKPVNLEQIQNAGAKGAAGRLVRQALKVAEAL